MEYIDDYEYRFSKGKIIILFGMFVFLVGIIGLTWLIFGHWYTVYVDFFTATLSIIQENIFYFVFLLGLMITGILIMLRGKAIENNRIQAHMLRSLQ